MKGSTLITGSSKGLGQALASIFLDRGYKVILHGRDVERLEEIRRKSTSLKGICGIVRGDLNEESTTRQLFRVAEANGISTLINNAAIDIYKRFEDLALDEIQEVVSTNLIAPMKLTRRIYPLFVKQHKGMIININSLDGINTGERRTGYSASKYGLRGWTDSLRMEAKNYGIRVIGIYLRGMQTEMYSKVKGDYKHCMDPTKVAEKIFEECILGNSEEVFIKD
jgi:short-subunit dehydrogenase